MKVQDVLLKAMAKKITWWAAAEIIGVTDRTMRRWREKLEKDGYAGLADRRKGKPSAQAHSAGDDREGARTVQGDVLRPEHPALPRKAAGRARDRVELHLGTESTARRWAWWPNGTSGGRTGGGGRGGRCLGCCCTSTAASIDG